MHIMEEDLRTKIDNLEGENELLKHEGSFYMVKNASYVNSEFVKNLLNNYKHSCTFYYVHGVPYR